MPGSGSNVFARSRVASSLLACAAVFETPGGEPGFGDGGTKAGGMGQVVLRFPETSVDEDEDWVGTGTCREADMLRRRLR